MHSVENLNSCNYCVNKQIISYEWMDGQVIAVNLLNGHYYNFYSTAALVFMAISEDIALTKIAEFMNSPEDSLSGFLKDLIEEGLIISSGEEHFNNDKALDLSYLKMIKESQKIDFSYEKYTDIAELIALDPVHEISNKGWPEKQ